jgi:hypothetical protein
MLSMGVTGTTSEVAGRLADLRDEGADIVYLHLYDVTDSDHIRLLGAEVLSQLA